MKDWEPCFTAIVNLIGLGEGVLDLLLAEGYLQQLFEIIARDPSMYLNEFDLSRNLLVYSTTSTLRQMLQMNLLSLLRQSGTLNICLTEALETSPTVLEHLLELNVISDLVAMRSEEIYQGLSCCVEVAAKTDQIRELTDQGIVRFFLSCLNQYVNTENTLKVLLVILRADHSTDSISMVRESELIMIKQLTGHQKASISQFAKELLSLINVC